MIEFEKLKKMYLDAITESQPNRDLCERDRDYYDNKQWTSEEETELRKRKQPIVTLNRIKPKIDSLIGIEIQSRVDPKAYPREPDSEDSAEAATDALRYVADNADFDQCKTDAAYNLFVEGTCAAVVEVEKTAKGFEVIPRHIPWDRFFIDMHSCRKDGKDAKFMGQAIWMDTADARAMFPDADESLFAEGSQDGSVGDTYDDKPRNALYDKGRDRVKIIEMFYHSGQWHHVIFTGNGEIIPSRLSPYLDDCSEPCNPIEMQSAFVDRDGQPYGTIRQMISAQDEVNKRRSKALHLISVKQVIADDGAVEDVNKARREMAKPDGWIVKNPGKDMQVVTGSELAASQFQLLQESKGEIDQLGANAAITGKEDRNMSGRALQVRQQSGAIEISPVMDGLRSWETRIYRQMWARIKQFWTEQKWIRVTDDEKNIKFIGLNYPVTVGQVLQQRGTPYDALDPRNEEIAYMQNNLAELDVDIILDVAPDLVNIQAEQFELLAQMYQANPNAIPFDMVIEASDIRNKNQILEKIRGETPEAQQAQQIQQEAAQRQQQIAEQSALADIKTKEAKALKDMSEAEAQDIENDAILSGIMEALSGQASGT